MRTFSITAFLLLCCLYSPSRAAEAPRRFALVVGVKTYEKDQPLDPLPYAENDAKELAALLRGGGYDVILMTQANARETDNVRFLPTARKVTNELDAILEAPGLGDNDVVVVAFAGHGMQLPGPAGGAEIFYLLPMDADIGKQQNLLSLEEIYKKLGTCKAGTKVVFADACRNDPNRPGFRAGSVNRPNLPAPPGGLAAYYSCSAGQRAVEDRDLKHGVFFHFVIEGMGGKAADADGQVTLAGLHAYVSKNVFKFVREKYDGARQVPELKGEDRLSVLLDTKESKDFAGSIGMKFVRIEPGTFMMGSPKGEVDRSEDETLHKVTITRPYMMATTHVTRRQFSLFVAATGYKTGAERSESRHLDGTPVKETERTSWRRPGFPQADDHPVVEVSRDDAVAFCKWLSDNDRKTYRLPTEAEWEYACRGGTQTAYFWGDNPDTGSGYVNCHLWEGLDLPGLRMSVVNFRVGFKFTSPVATYKPNKFGLYDMIGNAWEWCDDYYGDYSAGASVDPKGPSVGNSHASRVLRGGSWHGGLCRSAFRRPSPSTTFDFDEVGTVGFRVCLQL